MTKEEFNNIWKETSRENILNQFYYDYMYMKKLKEDINKAIELNKQIKSFVYNEMVDRYVPGSTELYVLVSKELEILRGGEDIE